MGSFVFHIGTKVTKMIKKKECTRVLKDNIVLLTCWKFMFKDDDKRNKKISSLSHHTLFCSKKKSLSRPSLCDYYEDEKQKKIQLLCTLKRKMFPKSSSCFHDVYTPRLFFVF